MTKAKQLIDSVVTSKASEQDYPPTIVLSDGTKKWFVDGKLHRDGGPAIVRPSGSKLWYQHGQLHRDNGPAVEWHYSGNAEHIDGTEWYKHGKLHRLNGPAIEASKHGSQWWVNGREFTEDEFYRYVDQDTGEVLVPPGKKLKYG